MLVFDVTDKASFENIESVWHQMCIKHGDENFIPMLIGNKSEVDNKQRQVSTSEAKKYAKSRNFNYVETSASTGKNVEEAFEQLTRKVVYQ